MEDNGTPTIDIKLFSISPNADKKAWTAVAANIFGYISVAQ